MMIIKKFTGLLLFIALLVTFYPVTADIEKDKDGAATTEQEAAALAKKCKTRIIGAPLGYYTPETHLAFGAAGSYILRLAGCDTKTRPSSISPLIIYTTQKQFKTELKTEWYFKNNNYHLITHFKAKNYPDKFYGIGNSTLKENEELFTSKDIDMSVTVLKNMGKGFNIGLGYHVSDWTISKKEAGRVLDSGVIIGSDRGTISGINIILNLDTRDNIYFPMKGDFSELSVRVYPKFLGSAFEYSTFSLDLRKYFTVFSKHVFAAQVLVKAQTGDAPFLELTRMGGQNLMRGYFDGRYRDKNLLVIQAEYRAPLIWRFGLVGFAGLGNVSKTFANKDMFKLKPSYGVGLRFLFDKKERIQVRFDYGKGKGTSGFYASIFEAF